MSPNDADGIANSVDPDQTAPVGAVLSGSALFALAYLSENLGSLRYVHVYSQAWLDDHERSFGHFIGGKWVKPEGRKSYQTKNPATGRE